MSDNFEIYKTTFKHEVVKIDENVYDEIFSSSFSSSSYSDTLEYDNSDWD